MNTGLSTNTEPKPNLPGNLIWLLLLFSLLSTGALLIFLLYQISTAPLKNNLTTSASAISPPYDSGDDVLPHSSPDDQATDRLIQSASRYRSHYENSREYLLAEKHLAMNYTYANKSLELVPYTGPIEHIFFHPLIAYPELAFDNDQHSQGYNDWFVTVNEFTKILDSLYQNDYILINSAYLYEEQSNNDQKNLVEKSSLLLPPGKKPLIISIDDLNYYEYMVQNGNVHKLVLDEKGNVATLTATNNGETLAHDNEIIPILDQFVRQHPDFSLNGAKGTIALTGYEGILGYRLAKTSPDYEQEKSTALAVVKRLKETGWTFASHGYGHLDARTADYSSFVRDTSRWKQEVEPLLGPTNIYIYPFGSTLDSGDPKFQYLLDSGFQVFYGVGPQPYLKSTPDYLVMDRRHIDGIALSTQGNLLSGFFDSTSVLDPARPAFD